MGAHRQTGKVAVTAAFFLVLGCGSGTRATSSTAQPAELGEPSTARTAEAAGPPTTPTAEPGNPSTAPDGSLVGVITRADIESAEPIWANASATPDPEASQALASVDPGARVDVFLGTWCGDSRREVTRLWSALDQAGDLPFEIRYVGMDRAKEAPDGLADGADIEYVPTIIVYRDDSEVGRIVESAPEGIEVALLALLRGEQTGVISGRADL